MFPLHRNAKFCSGGARSALPLFAKGGMEVVERHIAKHALDHLPNVINIPVDLPHLHDMVAQLRTEERYLILPYGRSGRHTVKIADGPPHIKSSPQRSPGLPLLGPPPAGHLTAEMLQNPFPTP